MQTQEELQTLIASVVPRWRDRLQEVQILSGGITNSNFRVVTEIDGDVHSHVVRLYGGGTEQLGIDRANEIACHRIAADMGIAPPLFTELCSSRALVSQWLSGETLDEAAAASDTWLPAIVTAMRRYHGGPEFPGTFSPFQTVRDYLQRAEEKAVEFPQTLPHVLQQMDAIEATLAPFARTVPCHNDLLAANFIADGDRVWVLDWEYAGMGDPYFDLGNFAVNQGLDSEQKQRLLAHYFRDGGLGGRYESDDVWRSVTPWHLAYLELMTLASDLRESFWGFLQSAISNLDFDYLEYAIKHFERFQQRAQGCQAWLDTVRHGPAVRQS